LQRTALRAAAEAERYDAGLLDEIIVHVGSIILGKGKPLFPRRVLSSVLRLISVCHLGTNMVELRYEVNQHHLMTTTKSNAY
jgi:riboflavin biosynthesis pyrimidine reductase